MFHEIERQGDVLLSLTIERLPSRITVLNLEDVISDYDCWIIYLTT
jgi:hypothetical protein